MNKTIVMHFTMKTGSGRTVEEQFSMGYSARSEKDVVSNMIKNREDYYGLPIIVTKIRKLEVVETDLSGILAGE